jgi:hypothetical protein
MSLCQHFRDPAEYRDCHCGVQYGTLAGGGVHEQIMRLPCVPISNRKGNEARHCAKYAPTASSADLEVT